MATIPAPTPENHQPLASGPTHRFGRGYLAWLFFFGLVIYLLPFLIMRLPGYDHVVGTFYAPLLEYGFSLEHVDADVVIFGDSTAIYAVDPLAAGKALGLKMINIPNTIGSLPVTGEQALDRYLQHNRAPRLIVFHFSAWDLDYGNTPPLNVLAPHFEGEDMLVRHGTLSQIAGYFRHNLQDLVELPFSFYAVVPWSTVTTLYHRTNPFVQVAAGQGRVDYPPRSPLLDATCRFPVEHLNRTSTRRMDTLVARYGGPSRTLVYIAPLPACAGFQVLTERVYRGGKTAPPAVLPADLFGIEYSHVRVAGVATTTDLFVQAVRPALAAAPPLPVKPAPAP